MKLFILALVILLLLVILEVTSFFKEGLETGPTASNSGMGNITLIETDEKKKKDYNPKILGGSLLTLNQNIKPYTYSEESKIIDPDAADLEAVKSGTAEVQTSERALWYGTDDTIKANFEPITEGNPLYKVAVVSTNESSTYDDLMKVCSKGDYKQGQNPTPGANDYMYGWSKTFDSKFPCVGFYSHSGTKKMNKGNVEKKWSILTSCKNGDCDSLEDSEKFGKNYYPKYPDESVDEVYGQKAKNAAGRKLNSAMGNLEEDYKEVKNMENVELAGDLGLVNKKSNTTVDTKSTITKWIEKTTALWAGTKNTNWKGSGLGTKVDYEGCKTVCDNDKECLGFEYNNFETERCALVKSWADSSKKFRLDSAGNPKAEYVGKFQSAIKDGVVKKTATKLDDGRKGAMIGCSMNSISDNPCVGIAMIDGKYNYLYPTASKYFTNDSLNDEVWKKVKTTGILSKNYYINVEESNPMYGARAITLPEHKRVEGYTNYYDTQYDKLDSAETFDAAKLKCDNYKSRCIGFFKPIGKDKYYFLENVNDKISVGKSKITKLFKFKSKFEEKIELVKKNMKGEDDNYDGLKTTYSAVNNSLSEYDDNNNIAESILIDGSITGGITKFLDALQKCVSNIFPDNRVTNVSDPICVGLLSEKLNDKESRYNFLRFNQDGDSYSSVRTININDNEDYDEFFPRKKIYIEKKFINMVKALDNMKNLADEHNKEVMEFMKDFGNKTESQINNFTSKINNYTVIAKNNLLSKNSYGNSLYGLLKILNDHVYSSGFDDSGEYASLISSKSSNASQIKFDLEKHFMNMFFISKYFLPVFKFFYDKRKELDKKKISVKNAWKSQKKEPKLNYSLRELLTKTEFDTIEKTNKPDTGDYFFLRKIAPVLDNLVNGELAAVTTTMKNTSSNGYPLWWWDQLNSEFSSVLANMTIKCGGALGYGDYSDKFKAGFEAEGETELDGHIWCYKNAGLTKSNAYNFLSKGSGDPLGLGEDDKISRCSVGNLKWERSGYWYNLIKPWLGLKWNSGLTDPSCMKTWYYNFSTRSDWNYIVYQSNIYFKKQYDLLNDEIDRLNAN